MIKLVIEKWRLMNEKGKSKFPKREIETEEYPIFFVICFLKVRIIFYAFVSICYYYARK